MENYILQIYDPHGVHLDGFVFYTEAYVTHQANGLRGFNFSVLKKHYALFQEEGYVESAFGKFVIKGKQPSEHGFEVFCEQNIEPLKNKAFRSIEIITKTAKEAAEQVAMDTDYTVVSLTPTIRRSLTMEFANGWEVLQEIIRTYDCEMRIDEMTQTIYIEKSIGKDQGTYYTDELNLTRLEITSDSFEFFNRITPIGHDEMGIESVNGGVPYIQDTRYSSKIVHKYWRDERYHVAQNLKEDAAEMLAKHATPLVAYASEVVDLSFLPKYSFLQSVLYDTVTLISTEMGFSDVQKIVMIREYVNEPWRNVVTLANKEISLIPELDKVMEEFTREATVRFQILSDSIQSVVSQVQDVDGDLTTFKSEITQRANEIDLSLTKKADADSLISQINLSTEGVRILGKNLTLDGNTTVLGTFSVPGSSLFGTIDAQTIRIKNQDLSEFVRGFLNTPTFSTGFNNYQPATMKGSSIAYGANSSYIQMRDTGGRGQIIVDGTIAVSGSTYFYEMNADGFAGGPSMSGAATLLRSTGTTTQINDGQGGRGFNIGVGISAVKPLSVNEGLSIAKGLKLDGYDVTRGADGNLKWS